MAKSRIIQELANNDVALDVALRRLIVIASSLENNELSDWAIRELNGYRGDDSYPPYRVLPSGNILYSGLVGAFQVSSIPLPLFSLSSETRELIMTPYKVSDSVSVLENIVKEKLVGLSRNLSFFAQSVFEDTGGHIQCTSIWAGTDYLMFERVLSALRTMILQLFISLDRELGNLDDLDIDTRNTNLDELRQVIFNVLYQDKSTHLEDKRKSVNDSSVNLTVKGDVTNSALAAGLGSITQTVNNNEYSKMIAEIIAEMRKLVLTIENEDIAGDVTDALDQIENELDKQTPSDSKFKRAMKRIEEALLPIKNITTASTLLVHANSLIPLISTMIGAS